MIDFLRANTWCSQQHYLWEMSVAQVQLSSVDFTHIDYNRRKAERKKGKKGRPVSVGEMMKNTTDYGVPIINRKDKKEE